MSDHDNNWKFVGDMVVENEVMVRARQHSLEVGVTPVDAASGAQLALVAAASQARNILEIGTGTGVSGLWLLHGAPRAGLTSIDSEVEFQQSARQFFTEAGHAPSQLRLIAGRALDVLPRMNEDAYDIVFVDADPGLVIELVEHALRLARPGGTVLVAHALWSGKVANPASRDTIATGFRTLITEIAHSSAVISALNPAGDGLLLITKLGK